MEAVVVAVSAGVPEREGVALTRVEDRRRELSAVRDHLVVDGVPVPPDDRVVLVDRHGRRDETRPSDLNRGGRTRGGRGQEEGQCRRDEWEVPAHRRTPLIKRLRLLFPARLNSDASGP